MVRSTSPDKRKWCESHWNHARTYYTRYRILDTNLTIAEGHLSETCKEALVIHHIFDVNSRVMAEKVAAKNYVLEFSDAKTRLVKLYNARKA